MWDRILVSIGLDATQLEAGAKRAQSAMTRLSGYFTSNLKGAIAGAFSVGAIAAFTKSAIDAANKIKDLADQTGLSTDEVQKLDFAAKQVGTTFEGFSAKLDKLTTSRRDAVNGNVQLINSFAALGVSMEDVADSAKSNLDIFNLMSGGSRDRTALMDVFGKGGGQLAAVLESLDANSGEGVFFKQADIDAIDTLSETVDKLVSRGQGFWAGILAPIGNGLLNKTEDIGFRKAAIESLRTQFGTGGMLRRVLNPFDSSFKSEIAKMQELDASSQAPASRKLSITDQRNILLNQMAAEARNPRAIAVDPLRAQAEAEAAINQKVAEMFSADAEKRRRAIEGVNPRAEGFAADSMARIGGFVGGAGAVDPSLTVAMEGNRILTRIERVLEEIKQDTKGPGVNDEFAP